MADVEDTYRNDHRLNSRPLDVYRWSDHLGLTRNSWQSWAKPFSTMQTGVLTQNREMVEQAGQFIFNHPAPNHAPWDIMPDADQGGI